MNAADIIKVFNFYTRLSPSYTKIGYYTRRLFWQSIRYDFNAQHWLVTGASAGIGKAIMHTAATAGAEVLAVGRSEERLRAAIAELPDHVATRVTALIFDMSLQRETEQLLQTLLSTQQKINVLINNVGILLHEFLSTEEGRETSFVTNLLSHFQLTKGLLRGAAFADNATIVNMSSGGMYNVPQSIEGLNTVDASAYNGKAAYAFAKRGQMALTDYWNKNNHNANGLRVYAMHPGWARTPGVDSALPGLVKTQGLILRNPAQGADTCLWLCARRPDIGAQQAIWFDRKPRPAHIYPSTRTALCTTEELVEYLRRELASCV